MKRRIIVLASILLPLLIVGFAINFEMKRRTNIATSEMGNRLFSICTKGAETSKEYKVAPETTTAICGCFARTVLRHRSVSVAGIVSDPDMVKGILQGCSKRTQLH